MKIVLVGPHNAGIKKVMAALNKLPKKRRENIIIEPEISKHQLDKYLLKELNRLEKQVIRACRYESRYAKKVGYEKAHYWLIRKMEDVIGLAIQDVEDRLQSSI